MNKYGKQWHRSPDTYEDAGDAGAPARKHYAATPTNVTRAESPKHAGGTPEKVQGSDGTENRRAQYKTKSARVPEPGKGHTIGGAVDSYGESGRETV